MLIVAYNGKGIDVLTFDDISPQQKRLLGVHSDHFNSRMLNLMIEVARAKGVSEIKLPEGVHFFNESVVISDAHDLVIDGQHATWVFTNRLIGLQLVSAAGLELKNISIAYDPLPFTQGTIADIGAGGRWYDVRIDEGYPLDDELINHFSNIGYDMMVVDPIRRSLKPGTPDYLGSNHIEKVSDDIVRVHFGYPTNRFRAVELGDAVVMKFRGAHAVQLVGSRDTTINSLTIYNSPHMGIVETDGEGGNRYNNVKIVPGDPPVGAMKEPLLSANFDAFHSISMKRGPVIDGCYFEMMGDDGINVNSPMAVIVEVDHPHYWIAPRNRSAFTKAGDTLQFVDRETYHILGEARILEAQVVSDQRLLNQARGFWRNVLGPSDPPVIRVTVEETNMNVPRGSLLSFPDRAGKGAVIQNCTIRGNRARAMLVRAPHALIQNNQLEDISLAGIVVVPEINWMEGPIPYGITIRGNVIKNMGLSERGNTAITPFWGSGIAVLIADGTGVPKHTASIHDIVIEENVISGSAAYDLIIQNALGVEMRGNILSEDQVLISHSENVLKNGSETE